MVSILKDYATAADTIALGVGTMAYLAMIFLHPVLIGVPVIGWCPLEPPGRPVPERGGGRAGVKTPRLPVTACAVMLLVCSL